MTHMLRQTVMLGLLAAGCTTFHVTDANAGELGVETRRDIAGGAEIVRVLPGSAAERLGLKPGYTILGWGTRQVSDPDALAEAERATRPGRWEKILYRVRGELNRGPVTVSDGAGPLPPLGRIGVSVADHSGPLGGVKIEGVASQGPAWQAGLDRCQLLSSVNDNPVKNADEFKLIVANNPGRRLRLTAVCNGRAVPAFVTPQAFDATGVLAAEPPVAVATRTPNPKPGSIDEWCNQSSLLKAGCATVAVIGGAVLTAILLSGGEVEKPKSDQSTEADRQRKLQRDHERAVDLKGIRDRSLPR